MKTIKEIDELAKECVESMNEYPLLVTENKFLKDEIAKFRKESRESISILKSILDALERGWGMQAMGSRESKGFLVAATILKEKLNTLKDKERENEVKEEVQTINKSELTSIIKQHFDFEDVEIEKVCAGSPTIATCVYPTCYSLPLLYGVDIRYIVKGKEE